MKTANNCPKCAAKVAWTDYQNWHCGSDDKELFVQSDLCRERVKVAKLRKNGERQLKRP